MVVARDGRLPLTMIVAPLRPLGIGAQTQPLALVIVRDPEAATLSTTALRELLGFTRSEAVIARDLASGISLDDLAERRGIGAATVRSHLKRILSKTETHRQAEAVALIARSVAGIDHRT
jgi:DNA-binding CsgD family transcriptional regulator